MKKKYLSVLVADKKRMPDIQRLHYHRAGHFFVALAVVLVLIVCGAGQAFSEAVALPRSGQTTCYDGSGNVIDCAGTGQDGDIQAGVPWPDPRFTDNGNNTVTDNLTGLMWTKNANIYGLRTWSRAISDSNACTVGGYSDWRLPNINELESLVNTGVAPAAWLNTQGFTGVMPSFYWSSSTYTYTYAGSIYTNCAWDIHMGGGEAKYFTKFDHSFYVWPVRSFSTQLAPAPVLRTGQTISYATDDDGAIEAGVAWPVPRFTDNSDGTVTDNLTGLMWLKQADCFGRQIWINAFDQLAILNTNPGGYPCGGFTAAYNDWRLPNRKELLSLLDRSQLIDSRSPQLTPSMLLPTGHPFINVIGLEYGYGSSTTRADDPINAWGVNVFRSGEVFNLHKSAAFAIWAVRGGEVLVDTDGDGEPDISDPCPDDPNKIDPGVCGCGVPDVDTDGDGAMDCVDNCPDDSLKTDPGVCGCGVNDVDSDSDGVMNCDDGCPFDPDKIDPGVCDCGVADVDTDGDGAMDCVDNCPDDPDKAAPGVCGCGVADTDTDTDGTPDCNDGCPDDPAKTDPGVCGCGVSDADSDGDGTPNCHDGCPGDRNKVSAGACGCGVSDADSDGDGTPNCHDGCPGDSAKIAPGSCGCGVVDTDTDADGTPDCNDGCVDDPAKIVAGVCGCDVSDVDSDGDGTPDCNDSGDDEDACGSRPGPVSPPHNATGISLTPTLEIAFDVDPDLCGEHNKTLWQISERFDFNGLTYNQDSVGQAPVTHQVPPGVLEPNRTYVWRTKVWCSSGCESEYSAASSFMTGSNPGDADRNGIPDDQEPAGETDLNGDGQPDTYGTHFQAVNTVVGNVLVAIETTGNITFLESLDNDDQAILEGMPADMPWGLINFRIETATVGETVPITVYFEEQAPEGSVFYKYDPENGWIDYSAHAVFAPDMNSVTIEIQDGGFGDLDGVANGVIVDPSGIGVNDDGSDGVNNGDGKGGGSGGWCFIDAVMSR